MSTRTCARALVPALLLASQLLHAADHPIHVVNPFAYATPPGAPTAAVYLTLHNSGATADRLVAVATPAAGRVEIHSVQMADGLMRMRAIDGVDLPAGAGATLERGGRHLMLLDLPRPLVVGDRIELTLRFLRADPQQVTVPVVSREAPSSAAPHAH